MFAKGLLIRPYRAQCALRLMSSESSRRPELNDGKTFNDFLPAHGSQPPDTVRSTVSASSTSSTGLKFYIETYGCQMNVSDSEIVHSVLRSAGHEQTESLDDAHIVLANTCAIRENAESKIWHRISFFNSMKIKNRSKKMTQGKQLF